MTTSQPFKSSNTISNTEKADHPVADQLQETLHESVNTLTEKAGQAESAAREALQNGSENLEQKQQEMKKQWESSAVKQYAVENPVATAGIAFAAGVLLTALLKK